MSIITFFRGINLSALPDNVSTYIEEEILPDVEGMESVNEQNEVFIQLKALIEEKYPAALGKTPEASTSTEEPTRKDVEQEIEVLQMVLESMDDTDPLRADVEQEIEVLGMVLESMPEEMAKGGNVDLFQHQDQLPDNVREILNRYQQEEGYDNVEKMKDELEAEGYTFDYYLDEDPENLRKISKVKKKKKKSSKSEEIDESTYF